MLKTWRREDVGSEFAVEIKINGFCELLFENVIIGNKVSIKR